MQKCTVRINYIYLKILLPSYPKAANHFNLNVTACKQAYSLCQAYQSFVVKQASWMHCSSACQWYWIRCGRWAHKAALEGTHILEIVCMGTALAWYCSCYCWCLWWHLGLKVNLKSQCMDHILSFCAYSFTHWTMTFCNILKSYD